MKTNRFKEQVIAILREQEAMAETADENTGSAAAEVVLDHGMLTDIRPSV